jgi:hypothetical protein
MLFADHRSSQVTKKKERKKGTLINSCTCILRARIENLFAVKIHKDPPLNCFVTGSRFKKSGSLGFIQELALLCLLFFCLSYDRGRGPQCFEALFFIFSPFHKFRYDEHKKKKKKKNKKKKPCFLAKTSLQVATQRLVLQQLVLFYTSLDCISVLQELRHPAES